MQTIVNLLKAPVIAERFGGTVGIKLAIFMVLNRVFDEDLWSSEGIITA